MEVFGYSMTWLVVVTVFTSPGGDFALSLFIAAITLLIAHVGDAAVTFSIAKKGLTPKKPLVGNPEIVVELV